MNDVLSAFAPAGTINGVPFEGWRRAELSELVELALWLPQQVLDSPLGMIGAIANDLTLDLPETPKGVLGDPVHIIGIGILVDDSTTCIFVAEILMDALEEDYVTVFRTIPRNSPAINCLERRWMEKVELASTAVALIADSDEASKALVEAAREIVDRKIGFAFTWESPTSEHLPPPLHHT